MNNKIPRVIHYCWFGNKPKPPKVKECISSWRKFCPEYKILEWNESNINLSDYPYAKEAYDSKQYAFCSDYIRLVIIQKYGGIYLDTDVELIKNLDPLLVNEAFFAIESNKYINTGAGFGAKKGNRLVKLLAESYKRKHFIDPKSNKKDIIPCPQKDTAVVLKKYPDIDFTRATTFDSILFLPSEYFCPMDYMTKKLKITNNTYAIHWFSGSWMGIFDKLKKIIRKIKALMIG